jgi:hypothetical protein
MCKVFIIIATTDPFLSSVERSYSPCNIHSFSILLGYQGSQPKFEHRRLLHSTIQCFKEKIFLCTSLADNKDDSLRQTRRVFQPSSPIFYFCCNFVKVVEASLDFILNSVICSVNRFSFSFEASS